MKNPTSIPENDGFPSSRKNKKSRVFDEKTGHVDGLCLSAGPCLHPLSLYVG
ncbi:MAG: hypothetical protein I3J02_04225 [Prevotella sp.]|nr:hypothetical protein [Prevotella sp.]